MTETARCSHCHEEKPLTPQYFYRNRARPTGFDAWCKECRKAFVRTPERQAWDREYQHGPLRKTYRRQTHCIRLDEEAYAVIVRRKVDLARRHGRPVSMNEALSDLMREAGALEAKGTPEDAE